jgi:2-hydroxychromene-2-carboxylate isomerase
MIQFADIPAKMAYEQLEMERFIKGSSNTKFQMNPYFPINTLLIMRAAIIAEAEGKLDSYIDAVFRDMWESGLNMADPEVVTQSLTQHGFDGKAMLARTQDQAVKDKLISNTDDAIARGAFGIPTFFVENEMFFGKERLSQVEIALSS